MSRVVGSVRRGKGNTAAVAFEIKGELSKENYLADWSELVSRLKQALSSYGIDFYEVPPGKWKAGSPGRAKKPTKPRKAKKALKKRSSKKARK